jgi:hypothetical protein
MMINLWLLIYVFFLDHHHVHAHIYLFACIAFCYQCDVSLHVHVLHIVGLVVLRLNDACFSFHVNAS